MQHIVAKSELVQHSILHAVRLLWIILVSTLAPIPLTAGEAPTTKQPPNIVLILVDDLGWRDLACYGSTFYETPNIDRLASQGMRFTDAYAACAVCSPTRASVLSGQYPARLHHKDNDRTTPHGIVRKGDFKLIEYFEDGRLELYNLKADLSEKENLAMSQPDRARAMQKLLADWRQQVGAQMPLPKKL